MTACAFWTSAKQASANVIRTDGVFIFMSGSFRRIPAACRFNSAQARINGPGYRYLAVGPLASSIG